MFGRLAEFRSAAAGAATGVATWIAIGHGAPMGSGSPAQAPARPSNGNIVCVASDGILRAAPGDQCSAGQTRFSLAKFDSVSDCDDCNPFDHKPPARTEAPTGDPLADIARRVDKLERSPVFEVVTKQGVVIFSVARENVRIFNSSQVVVAGMRATDSGGYFVGLSADHTLAATVGASGANAGLILMQNDVPRLDLGRRDAGNASLIVPSNINGPIAAIGESRAGGGALVVGDRAGRPRGSLTVVGGKGLVSVLAAGGASLLTLGQSDNGAGLFLVGDSASEPVVKIGVNNDRYGAVLTGPRAGLPYVPRSGLPGSYFFGCASCGP